MWTNSGWPVSPNSKNQNGVGQLGKATIPARTGVWVKDPPECVRSAPDSGAFGNSSVRMQSLQVSTRTKARSSPDQVRIWYLPQYAWVGSGDRSGGGTVHYTHWQIQESGQGTEWDGSGYCQITSGLGWRMAALDKAAVLTNMSWNWGQTRTGEATASTSKCRDKTGHARLGCSTHQHM